MFESRNKKLMGPKTTNNNELCFEKHLGYRASVNWSELSVISIISSTGHFYPYIGGLHKHCKAPKLNKQKRKKAKTSRRVAIGSDKILKEKAKEDKLTYQISQQKKCDISYRCNFSQLNPLHSQDYKYICMFHADSHTVH